MKIKMGLMGLIGVMASGMVFGDVVQFSIASDYGTKLDSSVTGMVNVRNGNWTNLTSTTSGDTGGRIDTAGWVTFDPTGSNLILTNAGTSALGVDLGIGGAAIGGNVSNWGVDDANSPNTIDPGESMRFQFNQDVYLTKIILGTDVDFTVSWGSTSDTGSAASSYTFAENQVLTAGSWMTLQVTGETGSKLSGIVVETIPEPATVGLVGGMGAVLIFARRRFQM